MKLFTSYFANVKNIPSEDFTPISICGKAPDWWKGLQYKKLAPKWSFFSVWKETQDNEYYIDHFHKEVLDELNIDKVVSDLNNLSNGKPVVLLCYESPEKFCHRHLVAEWLTQNGYNCEEMQ